jgi:hypothetical protein
MKRVSGFLKKNNLAHFKGLTATKEGSQIRRVSQGREDLKALRG